jgi:peptide/nickel transport system ATP-binding protein
MMPALTELPPGCAFRARCARAAPACSEVPRLEEVGNRLVRCFFPL